MLVPTLAGPIRRDTNEHPGDASLPVSGIGHGRAHERSNFGADRCETAFPQKRQDSHDLALDQGDEVNRADAEQLGVRLPQQIEVGGPTLEVHRRALPELDLHRSKPDDG